jgi:Ca2+/H+ antiporter
MHFSPTLMFILSALAIIPLAGIMGKATANNQKDKIKKLINVTN